ncbi:MAG: PLP-dependent transferase [Calditrichaeota bacterium]|nr:MAG: PLP-dependent transferase [Calditrichota bacterium]
MIGGIVLTRNPALAARLAFLQNAVGAVPSPFDCWLMLRATKTLALRMKAHAQNGTRVAEFLAGHPGVQGILYPHHPSHPQYELALRQHKTPYGDSGSAGMVSFWVEDFQRAQQVMRKLKLFLVAESLGGVESLACHPASMTHASVPPEMRRRIGLTDGLIRLSCGVEDAEDLIHDLDQALGEQ